MFRKEKKPKKKPEEKKPEKKNPASLLGFWRVPRSVLARHYTDFSPERLKRIYDGAGLRVLS
jgi:hypothetical protein